MPSNIEIKNATVSLPQKESKKKKKILEIIKYETDDYFIKGHIRELNKAYTFGCFTSVNILARKIIEENLIIGILEKKYPPTSLENKELYFDIQYNRYKGFSDVLGSLLDKRNEFSPNQKAIKDYYDQAKIFKDRANDATHSWYYLVESGKEIDELKLQAIIELIKKIQAT